MEISSKNFGKISVGYEKIKDIENLWWQHEAENLPKVDKCVQSRKILENVSFSHCVFDKPFKQHNSNIS